jgi:hypothetical protein
MRGVAESPVQASGGGLTYQWRRTGANVLGATNAIYNVANASGDDVNLSSHRLEPARHRPERGDHSHHQCSRRQLRKVIVVMARRRGGDWMIPLAPPP